MIPTHTQTLHAQAFSLMDKPLLAHSQVDTSVLPSQVTTPCSPSVKSKLSQPQPTKSGQSLFPKAPSLIQLETQKMPSMVANNATGTGTPTQSPTPTKRPTHGGRLTLERASILLQLKSGTELTAVEIDLPTIKSQLETIPTFSETQSALASTPDQTQLNATLLDNMSEFSSSAAVKSSPCAR